MSEEMAVSDNTTADEAKVSNDEATTATVAEPEEVAVEAPSEPVVPAVEEPPATAEEDPAPAPAPDPVPAPEPEPEIEQKIEEKPEVKEEPPSDDLEVPLETPEADIDIKKEEEDDVKDLIETFEHNIEEDLTRGIKRRASSAFSDAGDEEFKGFDEIKLEIKAADYCRVLERLEAEVTAASRDLVPLRTVMATPPAPGRASKRPRKDTEGSRPSSALSSRSEGEGATDVTPEKNILKNIKEKGRNVLKQTKEALTQADRAKSTEKQVNHNDVLSTIIQDGISEGSNKGANSILDIDSENEVVKWIKSLTNRGFPISKALLKSAIIMKEVGNENDPSLESDPEQTWCQHFLKNHPEIRIYESEGIDQARDAPRDSLIRNWFEKLESFLSERGMTDMLKDPTRIYNGDETSFSLTSSGKVLAPKDYKEVSNENEKKLFTVFIMMAASGTVCPPLLMCPSKIPPKKFTENMPGHWFIGRNKLGQMSKEILYEFIANGFNNWLAINNVHRPVIVFLDGQKTYKNLSIHLSNFCDENGIILYSLPANSGNIMQPSEYMFRPLKQDWKQTVRNWQAKTDNLDKTVTKINFPKVLKDILDTDLTNAVKNGFRKCGLFPFDVEAVDFSKCVDFQERCNLESVSFDRLTLQDFETALKVVNFLKNRLINRGIDSDVVIKEIESAISSFNE